MKTGIVLEGGAIRTIFSSGVCDALLTGDIMTDYVIGVSAGIAYGVSYVSRQIRRNLDIMVNYVNDKRYMGMGNLLRRNNRAYFGLDFVFGEIPNKLIPFDALSIRVRFPRGSVPRLARWVIWPFNRSVYSCFQAENSTDIVKPR